MSDQLIRVKFKTGTIRELSAHIANDVQHQKSLGFTLLTDEGIEIPVFEEKKSEQVEESPVAEMPKKRGRKPKEVTN